MDMLSKRIIFLLGIIVGGITLGVSLIIRNLFMGLFLPEVAVQIIFTHIPFGFEALIESEQAYQFAKNAILLSSSINTIILYGTLAIVLHRYIIRRVQDNYLNIAISYTLITYIATFLISIIFLQLTEVLTHPISIGTLLITLIPPQIVYGFSLSYLQRWVIAQQAIRDAKPPTDHPDGLSRRKVLQLGILGATAAVVVLFGFDRFIRQPSQNPPGTPSNLTKESFLEMAITPNDLFYKIDINVVSPNIDSESWKLKVHGLVDNPIELTYDDMQAYPANERYATLECISNPVGGDLISNALWKGTPLKNILDQVQVQPEAVYIKFQCGDSYNVGIPLEKGLEEGTMLVYDMNGVPLPVDHGFPLRAIVPGIYGMMNAKWITDIELVNTVFKGFWQRRDWSNTAHYQTHSVIVEPGNSPVRKRFEDIGGNTSEVVVGKKVLLAGVAFAGDRGIASVEVSTDGGNNWEDADVQEALSEGAWVPWYLEWTPSVIGDYDLTVRAIDKGGVPQIQEKKGPFSDGATGYHQISIEVIADPNVEP